MTAFNPAAIWDSLPAETQRRFALAAVIETVAYVREVELGLLLQPPPGWSTASAEAWNTMREIADPDLAQLAGQKEPDLAAIGLRSCEVCGCTDRYGCAEGCSWVGPRLCSACAPKAA